MLMRMVMIFAGAICSAAALQAGDVSIQAVEFGRGGADWTVRVTLKHDDTGWEHYADTWRVVDGRGKVLATRILQHPHVDEQPFTRSLSGVALPDGLTTVYVEAHDKVHGWSRDRVRVDLNKTRGDRYTVRR